MLLRIGRKLMWLLGKLLPVQRNKVLVVSFYGRGYGDNPKYIAEELLRRGGCRIIWAVKSEKEKDSLPAGVKACRYDSVAYIYHTVTAGVWVDNCRRFFQYKKKGQSYLQTWHGVPLKRIERDVEDKLEPGYVQAAIRDSAAMDLLLSDGTYATNIYKTAFWYEGEIAEWGAPRNDIILKGSAEVSQKVRAFYGFAPEKKLALYAPTFRSDHSLDAYSLDAEGVAKACAARFGGDWAVLCRLHPNVASRSAELFAYDGKTIVDATMYPDMQELLVAADLVISDYSSLMFDFALSMKPCLQFATDIEAYKGDRDFYLPLDGLPFPLCKSNAELIGQLQEFDAAAYDGKLQQFFRETGFNLNGDASVRCADWILEKMK